MRTDMAGITFIELSHVLLHRRSGSAVPTSKVVGALDICQIGRVGVGKLYVRRPYRTVPLAYYTHDLRVLNMYMSLCKMCALPCASACNTSTSRKYDDETRISSRETPVAGRTHTCSCTGVKTRTILRRRSRFPRCIGRYNPG